MTNKTLQKGSKYEDLDTDGDGIVSDEEMSRAEKLVDLDERRLMVENQDKREDSQRAMSWFALLGMLLYPFAVVFADWLDLKNTPNILGDMAPTYFVSVAAIVAAFYGTQAYTAKTTKTDTAAKK
jgi:hypothetical protein